ncbi:hypothetical protein J8655_05820 [Dickeya oryzae]|nr:hypothetical protein [Dickeya oryzae]MBP2844997.1 hypothetical protein [Dickeya oryzae]
MTLSIAGSITVLKAVKVINALFPSRMTGGKLFFSQYFLAKVTPQW